MTRIVTRVIVLINHPSFTTIGLGLGIVSDGPMNIPMDIYLLLGLERHH